MWGVLLAACLTFPISFVVPNVVFGQSSTFSLPEIPVLTIERERLYSETQFGLRLANEISARGRQLASENRRIEQELADEETELTSLRETLEPEPFRDLADAFDVKVTKARTEQDSKARELTQLSELAERRFLFTIAPVMERLMSEKGAGVVLDRRAVFVSADSSDVTLEAIARIDEALGEGMSLDEIMKPSQQTGENTAPEQ